MIKEEAKKHGIQLESRIADIKPIMVDGRKLKQVLYNLLSNAIKFTPAGGMVTLSSRMTDCIAIQKSGKRVLQLVDHPVANHPDQDHQALEALEITVSDTGIGIKPEVIDRIFESFEQADGSISRKYEGTGLGLSLSRAFIDLHGGTITAESQGEGKGARFCVLIPIESWKS